ncbi:MAG: Gfo/Idh/MocA family oxidoreductase [Planctomycetes bacterium]|nr:Gfo/Idh/MocA family oxidoreductase [Planctomycetota bacterium]
MKSEPMRAAVVGCGAQGQTHLTGFKELEGTAHLVGVCDSSADRAGQAKEKFGADGAYTDLADMLGKAHPELVTIATPVAFHKPQTLAAFEAGAHVVCEKPLAMNTAEADTMFAAARRLGKKLSMGLQNRYNASGVFLKQFIEQGGLGDVFHARIYCGHSMNIPGWSVFHRRDLSGGGVLFATAVHPLDLVVWLMGNPEPCRVSAHAYQRIRKMRNPPITWKGKLEDCDVEDFCAGVVHFRNGASLDFFSDWLLHDTPCPQVEILGTYGKATHHPFRITLDDGNKFKELKPQLVEPKHVFAEIFGDLIRCIRQDETPRYRFSEMRNVQRIMDAAYRSASEGREVAV